ncbi:hypothetical protein [Rhodopseudomonas sp. BR0G17]|uniref:hypothetical protein n=1 Tax=Rhodopseudomonas sp. BR0G17 TaxID=2269368 RepID=UPI0013DE7D3B|nr:hypothetical protein [Rhodopseudomonas sp. BR0G17]NEW95527.1 hypothetical protein [Rhodopseudomonas sp. BR0G17]
MSDTTPRIRAAVITLKNPQCLHCVVSYAVGLWAITYAPKIASLPAIAPRDIATSLAQVTADFIRGVPDAAERAALQAHARNALDAAFIAYGCDVAHGQPDLATPCPPSGLH